MTYVERITDAEYFDLQRRFGGQVVVRRGAEVLLSAETYDELSESLDEPGIDWEEAIIQYIDPLDQVRAYSVPAPLEANGLRPNQ